MLWTDTEQGQDYIEELSKQVVADIAPEELDLFNELAADYRANPKTDLTEDEALAFGAGELMVLVTPAAISAIRAVVTFLLTEVSSAMQEQSAETIQQWIAGLFPPNKKDEQPVADFQPLSREQLEQIKDIVAKQGRIYGMDLKESRNFANATIGVLAIST